MQLIPDDIAAEKWFENVRWPEGKICPKCGCGDIQEVYNRRPQPLRCRKCRYFFSVRKGTVMEGTNIGLQKWAFAIYLMVTSPKGVASTSQYVDGNIHTNGMESFWAVVKRGYRGVYHHVSPKHLQRYVNEFAGRLNLRHLDTLGKMEALFRGTIGKYRSVSAMPATYPAARSVHRSACTGLTGNKE